MSLEAKHPRTQDLRRERDRQRMRELFQVAVAVMVCGIALLCYTWIHLELLSTQYHIADLEAQLLKLEERRDLLELEEAFLSSPQRVTNAAARSQQMQYPDLDHVVIVTRP